MNPYRSTSPDPAERAKSRLIHYFSLTLPGFDSDNTSEIAKLVDDIITAAHAETLEARLRRTESALAYQEKRYATVLDLVKRSAEAFTQLEEPLKDTPLSQTVLSINNDLSDFLMQE